MGEWTLVSRPASWSAWLWRDIWKVEDISLWLLAGLDDLKAHGLQCSLGGLLASDLEGCVLCEATLMEGEGVSEHCQ